MGCGAAMGTEGADKIAATTSAIEPIAGDDRDRISIWANQQLDNGGLEGGLQPNRCIPGIADAIHHRVVGLAASAVRDDLF